MYQQEEDKDHNAIHTMSFRGSEALYGRRDPAELGRENASACVAACFEEFVPNVRDVCRQLQQPESQRMYLWSLYCCDSVNCGVYIGDVGQSPNVDLIINECQNIGFPSIEDPGPPSLDYCMSSPASTITTGLPPQTWNAASETAQVTINPSADLTVYAATPGHTASLTSGTFASSPSTSIVPATASSTSTSSSIASKANTSRLSGGATAAIVIFSVIAVLAITALLLFLFRQRKKGSRSSSLGLRLTPYNNRPYPGLRSASLTHLIPPPPSASSRSARLTPPAKLSDRKYLQPGRKPQAPQPSVSVTGGGQTCPTSPTRAPAQSQSKSRHKRGTATTSSHILTPTAAPTPQYSQSNNYSSTGPGNSTVTGEPNLVGSAHSCSSTVITNRPPPKHALPAIPPNPPNSSAFSISPTSPQSPVFPVSPLTPGDGPTTPHEGSVPATPASISAKELRALTESYARDTRESWGSWSGVGGGGPGVVSPSRRKGRGSRGSADRKDETKTVPVSHKLDLEKLGGGY